MQQLWLWLFIATAAQVLAAISSYIGQRKITKLGCNIEKYQLLTLYGKVFHADLRVIPEKSQGTVMRQLLTCADSVRSFVESVYSYLRYE